MPISFQIVRNNIVTLETDAVVNSANMSLRKGSGICRHIYHGADEVTLTNYIIDNFGENFTLQPGEAIITPGFDLPAKYIVHTITPKYYLGERSYNIEALSSCYVAIIKLAAQYKLKSIAIPCLGVGHHGWPLELSISVAFDTLVWLSGNMKKEINVVFCCYNDEQFFYYQKALNNIGQQ